MGKTSFSSGNRLLISRLLAVAAFLLLGLAVEGWHSVSPLVENMLSLLGWGLVGIGMLGRIWSSVYISGRKSAQLITMGPYSMCRNPLYFFSFVAGLGIMLLTETLLLPLAFSIFFWLYYRQVINREEEKLLKLHQATFSAYRSGVPRFWPNPRLYHEPASYSVSTAEFRSCLFDSLWFILAGGAIEFLETMHAFGHLPTFFKLY